jgi:hypothetical protein
MDLTEALEKLGLSSGSDLPRSIANFDDIAPRRPDDSLSAPKTVHQTLVAGDEAGTEAAAAGVAGTTRTTIPPSCPPAAAPAARSSSPSHPAPAALASFAAASPPCRRFCPEIELEPPLRVYVVSDSAMSRFATRFCTTTRRVSPTRTWWRGC